MMWANDNSLQRSVLTSELHRRLKRGGIGVKSCPSNGRVPRAMCIMSWLTVTLTTFSLTSGVCTMVIFNGIYHNSYSVLDFLIFFI